MTTSARSQFLSLLRDGEQALRDDFAAFTQRARGVLLSAVDPLTGQIPQSKQEAVQQQIAAAILMYFVAQHDGHAYAVSRGIVIPKSPFMRLLWAQITQATHAAVQAQADRLRAALQSAPDLIRSLEAAQDDPMLAYPLLTDDEGQTFFQNYQAPQAVVRGDNRVLGDRVLNAAASTRQKVGGLLRDQFSQGKRAADVADALTDYLTSPQGLYDASRLLGSETAFAHNRAEYASALLDPFIEQVDVVLSPSHPHEDECDGFADASPYALKDAPIPPFHSNCLCSWRFHVNGQTKAVIDRLRGSNLLRIRGPLSPGFADLLLRGANA